MIGHTASWPVDPAYFAADPEPYAPTHGELLDLVDAVVDLLADDDGTLPDDVLDAIDAVEMRSDLTRDQKTVLLGSLDADLLDADMAEWLGS